MLYTSGSTGKPKGVLHTVGGYMVQVGGHALGLGLGGLGVDRGPAPAASLGGGCGWPRGHGCGCLPEALEGRRAAPWWGPQPCEGRERARGRRGAV
jgi:hypothetical protein